MRAIAFPSTQLWCAAIKSQVRPSAASSIRRIRSMKPGTSRDLADLTVAFKGRGVVAFDLAGAEYNYPAKKHRNAFFTVINKNMATTIRSRLCIQPVSAS